MGKKECDGEKEWGVFIPYIYIRSKGLRQSLKTGEVNTS